ncbi:hypothetical protein QTP70_015335 [Hemibagrus guttatus]|uniref:Fibronectin type-III domain-containing protein n=1 Tax=Hemibagrus guttatus TaxID=175788 RepID=A0AAE0UIH5_9TELE|nr:hypothetical protein QTP70_015335 [Hemibagrus guttatus]
MRSHHLTISAVVTFVLRQPIRPTECNHQDLRGQCGCGHMGHPGGRSGHWLCHHTAVWGDVPKKDVRMMRFIQEVNTTTRSCALWDLEADTEYIVHVQSISMSGTSPPSDPVLFRTPKESEKMASKSPDDVTMKEVGQAQLRAGELIIIVVVLIMWAGVIALFCRQYDIIKDNEPNNNKDKAKNSSECSTPEHPTGGLLRSKV